MKCELCNREILIGKESEHHLIPKSYGGSKEPVVVVHEICHKQIHALFSNRELNIFYNTIEKLKAQKDIKRFVAWIENKPINFNTKIRIRRKNR